jgi:hypothetical protein
MSSPRRESLAGHIIIHRQTANSVTTDHRRCDRLTPRLATFDGQITVINLRIVGHKQGRAGKNSVTSACPLWGHLWSFTANHGQPKPEPDSSVLPNSCSSQARNGFDSRHWLHHKSPTRSHSLPWSSAVRKIHMLAGWDCGTAPWLAYRVPHGQPVSAVKGVGLRWSLQ